MPNVTLLFHRAGQSLGHHLDRLRRTFDELRDRVRDAAVQAIGQSIAGAVRDSIRAFLEGAATRVIPAGVQNFIRRCRFVRGEGEVGWSALVPG